MGESIIAKFVSPKNNVLGTLREDIDIMIKMCTSVMETKNYKMFRFMDGNRKTNSTNLNQLIESMKEKQLMIPITVNERFEIIDGQHRFKACEYLGLPVYYIMQQGYTIDDVIRANVNGGRKWFDADYLHRYCSRGEERYIKIKKIIEDFNITTNDYIKILAKFQGKAGTQVKREFREGNVSSDGQDAVISFLMAIESFKEFQYYKNSNFIFAFLELYLRNDYDHNVMERKIRTNINNLTKRTSKDDYLSLLCNKIYSFGATKCPIYYSSESKKFHK